MEAYTGTEADRPTFSEILLPTYFTNGCRTIVVECLDRLAHDLDSSDRAF